jgi:hypothetical protein
MNKLFKEYYDKHREEINVFSRQLPFQSKNHAVIIETRSIPDFGLIVKEHLRFLPEDFALTVFHSAANSEHIEKELTGINFNRVITDLKFSAEEQKAPHLAKLNQYNQMLTSLHFWDCIGYKQETPAETVLLFQTDSLLLKPLPFEELSKYSYIGARWKHNQNHCGNGGLSIRNISVMKSICTYNDWNKQGQPNEDIFYCSNIFKGNYANDGAAGSSEPKLAPLDIADTFSVEGVFKLGSVGCHAPFNWLKEEETRQILNQYA